MRRKIEKEKQDFKKKNVRVEDRDRNFETARDGQ